MIGLAADAPRAEPSAPAGPFQSAPRAAPFRQAVEFLLVLLVAGILFRSFVAEAYLVPSGSMAPMLLGFHKDVLCPACGTSFALGVEDFEPIPAEAFCPNCGRGHLDVRDVPVSQGDRLLVHKWAFQWRAPRRWEAIVFRNPNEVLRPFVKRVVGLPGESIEIHEGDVYVHGVVAQKSIAEFRELAATVYDLDRMGPEGEDPARARWLADDAAPVGWKVERGKLSLAARESNAENERPAARVEYRHVSDGGFEAPVKDDASYNPPAPAWRREPAADLVLSARLRADGPGSIELIHRADPTEEIRLSFTPATGEIRLRRRGELVRTANAPARANREMTFEAGRVDRRFFVAIDGVEAIEAFDLGGGVRDARSKPATSTRPIALVASDLDVELTRVKILRDIHYSSEIGAGIRPHAVHEPLRLGADEYFVLGDNSRISNDSRVWERPAVPRRLIIGKPILVHLPSRIWSAKVFGRTIRCSLPELSKVRRIH